MADPSRGGRLSAGLRRGWCERRRAAGDVEERCGGGGRAWAAVCWWRTGAAVWSRGGGASFRPDPWRRREARPGGPWRAACGRPSMGCMASGVLLLATQAWRRGPRWGGSDLGLPSSNLEHGCQWHRKVVPCAGDGRRGWPLPCRWCWCLKYALEAIIKWLLLYFLVHDNCLLFML